MVTSAGLMLFRITAIRKIEILLIHPGGPFFKNKDDGYWGIPKGLPEEDEEFLDAAIRECTEETGIIPKGPYLELGSVTLKSGKKVYAWACKMDADLSEGITSNYFSVEWPPKSGKIQKFQEVDKAEYMNLTKAKQKMNKEQAAFIDRLILHLDNHS